MGQAKEKELAEQVQRTQKLIEAGMKLKDYRDRIDEIIRVINSGEDFHDSLADECIDIGVTFQGLSKLLRPVSIEGKEKAKSKRIKARWKVAHNKAFKHGDQSWIRKYSKKGRYQSYGSWYEGPTDSFVQEFCSDIL